MLGAAGQLDAGALFHQVKDFTAIEEETQAVASDRRGRGIGMRAENIHGGPPEAKEIGAMLFQQPGTVGTDKRPAV